MHLVGDEICCLYVAENYISTNHYYDDNTIPPTTDMFRVVRNIAVHWERPALPKPVRHPKSESKLEAKRKDTAKLELQEEKSTLKEPEHMSPKKPRSEVSVKIGH
jgi:hypothetical protein